MKSAITSLILTGVLASASFTTFAQTTSSEAPRGPAAAASGTQHQHGARGGMHGKMDTAKRDAMFAKHMADLKAKLKLTADQEGAWTSFMTAMKREARMDHPRPDQAEMAKLPTPERIDQMRALRSQHMAERSAAMDKREEAIKGFYAALNADQKKTFDAQRDQSHGGGHHGMGHERATTK